MAPSATSGGPGTPYGVPFPRDDETLPTCFHGSGNRGGGIGGPQTVVRLDPRTPFGLARWEEQRERKFTEKDSVASSVDTDRNSVHPTRTSRSGSRSLGRPGTPAHPPVRATCRGSRSYPISGHHGHEVGIRASRFATHPDRREGTPRRSVGPLRRARGRDLSTSRFATRPDRREGTPRRLVRPLQPTRPSQSRKMRRSLRASQHDVTLALTAPPFTLSRLQRIPSPTSSSIVIRRRLRRRARSPPRRTRRLPFYGTGDAPWDAPKVASASARTRRTYALALRSGFRLRGVQS